MKGNSRMSYNVDDCGIPHSACINYELFCAKLMNIHESFKRGRIGIVQWTVLFAVGRWSCILITGIAGTSTRNAFYHSRRFLRSLK